MKYSFGENLMPPADNNNSKGFFEDLDIVAFNEELLSACQRTWYSLEPIRDAEVDNLFTLGFGSRAIELLDEKLAKNNNFAFKDPRTSKLLSFWIRVLSNSQYDVHYILAIRNPLSVAHSLAKRDGFDIENSYLLWSEYVLTTLANMDVKSTVAIDYDRLLADPSAELERTAKQLEMPISNDELALYSSDFLVDDLRHTAFIPDDVLLDDAASGLAKELYLALTDISAGRLTLEELKASDALKSWRSEIERQRPLFKLLDKQEARIREARANLSAQGDAIQNSAQALEERNSQISNVNSALQECKTKLSATNEILREREDQLSTLGQVVRERDRLIIDFEDRRNEDNKQLENLKREIGIHTEALTRLENHNAILGAQAAELGIASSQQAVKIKELNDLLSTKNAQNAQLSHEVSELLNSTSWKLSSPVRSLGIAIRRGQRLLKLAYAALRMGGGLGSTLKKAIAIYHREGISGIKLRLRIIQSHSPSSATPPPASHIAITRTPTRKKSPLEDDTITSLEAIRSIKLEDYDIISFDVFDTAVIRLLKAPTDVFRFVESSTGNVGFAEHRVVAERKSREKYSNKRDISISNIYENIDSNLDAEISAEFDFCVTNPIIYDLYSRARSAKKKIYFTSDMYLDKAHIEKILDKCGYVERESVFVSSDDNLIKGDGSRFEALKASSENQQILHIGDNILADYEWPKRTGIPALKFEMPEEFFRSDLLTGTLFEKLKESQSLGISFLLSIYRYWKYGDKSAGWDLWRDIGFFFGGPLIYSFAKHINDCKKDTASDAKLHFLARDGFIIKAVYDENFGSARKDSAYLLASRRAMTFPLFSLKNQDSDTERLLQLYSVIDRESSPQEVFDRLAYPDLVEILNDLQAEARTAGHLGKEAIDNILAKHFPSIEGKAIDEYNSLVKYLQKSSFFSQPAILVDVGWSGTIQDCIALLTKENSHAVDISGIYIGVNPSAKSSDRKSGFLFDKSSPKGFTDFSRYLDFVELLTAAPLPGAVRFTDSTDGVEFNRPNQEEERRIEVSREIHRGILDFSRLARKFGDDLVPTFSQEDFLHMFETLKDHASAEVIEHFDGLKHSRMPSESHVHPILDFEN